MNRSSENGNVFFYIFLGIAMFGALSYAVSQGNRGSVKGLSDEQNRLRATELIDYADTLAKAVATLRLRGTTLATLRFSNAALSSSDYGAPDAANALNEVFSSEGGGAVYHQAAADAITTASEDNRFLGGNEIKNIGTTCAAATCSDLVFVVGHIKPDVCIAINTYAGVNNPGGVPPTDSAIDLGNPFKGSMAYTATIGDETSSAALDGKLSGCFTNGADGANYFYRVLWMQ